MCMLYDNWVRFWYCITLTECEQNSCTFHILFTIDILLVNHNCYILINMLMEIWKKEKANQEETAGQWSC